MRTFVIRRLVRATTFVIVETEFARKCLVEQFRVSAQKVAVIPNAPSAPFISADSGQDAVIDFPTDACCRLLYVARGYPHKNHEFLAALGQELQSRHNLTVEFVVTLRPDEWGRTSRLFRKFSHNVGEVLVSQLPGIYRACDGAIFPSLAEVYSATPVEAIAAGVPLFACDRPYVRTVIGDAAAYFDPLDPYSAADVLARVIRDPTALSQLRELGRAVLRTLPTAAERAERYYGLIQDLRENGKPT
jgi:glycosyltransferase involved in cell wall biosynthesis